MEHKHNHHDEHCCENESEEVYKADGIDNAEHILDVFSEMKMLMENISDNTDLAFSLLKSIKEEGEADIVDSLTIFCSDILEQEKQSQDLFEKSERLVETSKSITEKEKLLKMQELLMEYFTALKLSEANSQALIEKVIKNFK